MGTEIPDPKEIRLVIAQIYTLEEYTQLAPHDQVTTNCMHCPQLATHVVKDWGWLPPWNFSSPTVAVCSICAIKYDERQWFHWFWEASVDGTTVYGYPIYTTVSTPARTTLALRVHNDVKNIDVDISVPWQIAKPIKRKEDTTA